MDRVGNYELSARIAKGGMAEIWVAANVGRRGADVERVCVVKRLLPQFATNEEHIQMFLEEGKLATAFDHPNVVRTFDFGTGERGGEPFLAMEYLHGEDLRSVLRTLKKAGQRLPLEQAVAIVRRVAEGLHHAHEARGPGGDALQVVHRDVSPHNVLLTFDGQVKVVDFGIAKSTSRSWETKHGTLKGKVPYMSPEQIKARKVDRRTDVYSAGVMLYELVLGKRPYVLSASGDFAQMMAIARHDVVPPTDVDPALEPALERIILQAIAYDPKDRYPSFDRMVADLDAFARAKALDTSTASLARFMASVFGARVDAWRAAISDDDALTHVIALEEARALQDPEEEEEATDVAAEEPLPISGTSPAVAALVSVGDLTVVTLRGKIDEHFEGAQLGRALRGPVLMDLEGVERVTSFGVREWIELTKALAERPDDVWLARCSEPIVTQMAHIRSFPGKTRLLSFAAPFLCNACGHGWSTFLDCERDAAWFGQGMAPVHAVIACPRCGGAGRLDDDPAFLSFATPYAGVKVPAAVRSVLATIEAATTGNRDWIEKLVSDDETRLRILRDVDPQVRWHRLLDGIEGRLVIEFRGAPRVTREAAESLVRALRGRGPEVAAIELVEAPLAVYEALAGEPRVRVRSVHVEGRCGGCQATRSGLVGGDELAAARRVGRAPRVTCRRCDGPLDLGALAPAAVAPVVAAPPMPAVVAPPGEAARPWLAIVVAVAAFVILVVAIVVKLQSP